MGVAGGSGGGGRGGGARLPFGPVESNRRLSVWITQTKVSRKWVM